MKRIRVLLADDHPIFLEGLKTFLTHEDPDIDVVATAANGREAVERERLHSPDVILMDIKMPVMDGIAAALAMRSRRPDAKIIMLTTFDDQELIGDALRAGAKGYLLKDARAHEVAQAIRTADGGHVLVLNESAEALLENAQRADAAPAGRGHPRPVAPAGPLPRQYTELTEREREILRLMVESLSNTEIAEELYISEKTVRNYVSHIYEVLRTPSRSQAVRWAVENGVVPVLHRRADGGASPGQR